MKCPFKFGNYDFEGAEDCIGAECGMFKRCNAETEITAVEFDALDDYAQALERENAELRKLCVANDTLAAENGVSEASVDANDVNADTREELEADAIQLAQNIWHQGMNYANGVREIRHIAWQERDVIDLLDRQAAITRHETIKRQEVFCDTCESVTDEYANELQKRCDELQAKVDELTEQLETAHAKNRSLRQHIAKMQEGRHGWHVKGAELQKQVEELTAENAKLSSELTAARNAHAQAEYDAETYRDKLGRMLDNAHEIERIGQI